jgi:hypothetical protein
MSDVTNKMRLAFAELTQGRNVTIEGRLLFEAGYMAGQKAMQEKCVAITDDDPHYSEQIKTLETT